MTGGKSELQPVFTSDTVQVQREEEAFSFGSLVADIGGVLGLFIGFNFLMAWDLMMTALRKVHCYASICMK